MRPDLFTRCHGGKEAGPVNVEEHAKLNPIPPDAVKEILAKLDCECTHPEVLHQVPSVATADIPEGHCRVSGCDCELFVEKKPEPEVRLCRICLKFKQIKNELCAPCVDRDIFGLMKILVERVESLEDEVSVLNGMLIP